MRKLVVTPESVRKFKEIIDSSSISYAANVAINKAVGALFVEEEEWVVVEQNKGRWTYYQKGNYQLRDWPVLNKWTLTLKDSEALDVTDISRNTNIPNGPGHAAEAQAWADGEIEKHENPHGTEVENLKAEIDDLKSTLFDKDALIKDLQQQIPKPKKPFGPGSKFRAKNGDILMVIETYTTKQFNTVSTITGKITHGNLWSKNLPSLHTALLAAGAIEIKD